MAAVGCRGFGDNLTDVPPGTAVVTVDPGDAIVEVGTRAQLNAIVQGVPDQRVTWSVVGRVDGGSIDTNGLYSAPTALPPSPIVQVSATSVADPSASGIATVRLVPAGAGGLRALALEPTDPVIGLGARRTLVARGTFVDGSTRDLSGLARWSSDAPAIASVESGTTDAGVVTGSQPGMTTIRAEVGAIAATTRVTVTSTAEITAIVLAPDPALVPVGASVSLSATASYSDGATADVTAQASWSLDDPSVASVGNTAGEKGVLSGVAEGTTLVLATLDGVTGTAVVDVEPPGLIAIEISPNPLLVPLGIEAQLVATGEYSDGVSADVTSLCAWTSDDAATVAVGDSPGTKGLVTGLAQGGTLVHATLGDVTGTAGVAVTPPVLVAVEVSPASLSLPKGLGAELSATAIYSDGTTVEVTEIASWSSDAPGIAAVSNAAGAKGRVSTLSEGTASIAASFAAFNGTASVTVLPPELMALTIDPASATVAVGLTQPFTATGTFTDGTTQDVTSLATWSTSASTVATVSNEPGFQGVATGLAAGLTIVTASLGTVSASVPISVSGASVVGISVTPPAPTVANGFSLAFTATADLSDGSTQDVTTQVTWSSGDTTIATISNDSGNRGVATGQAPGSTTITATAGSVSGSTTLTISPASLASLTVTPVSASVGVGLTQPFAALATYSDGTSQDVTTQVTWSSSSVGVASISNAPGSEGIATGQEAGRATITATSGTVSGSATLDVTAAVLVSITVSPATETVAAGFSVAFTATGTLSNGSTEDLTAQVTWQTSNGMVASVSNSPGSRGVALGVAPGTATITAGTGTISGTASLTVTSAALSSITVSPTSASVAPGLTQAFSAEGAFSDGSTQDLTTQVTWSSGTPAVASISNSAGSNGVATGLSGGTSTISATMSGRTGSATLTVSAATLTSISVSPASARIAAGFTTPFVATGTFSDGSTQDLTDQVTWSGSDAAVATVSNASGSEGVATGQAPGTTTITATLGAVSGSATLTVTNASLIAIAVAPVDARVTVGGTQAFFALGEFSDGTAADITTSVSWSSGEPSVATISNAPGSQGLASAAATGTTGISAAHGGTTGTGMLRVTTATLTSIAVVPSTSSRPGGAFQTFAANGTFSDGSTFDLTAQVSWSSSATTVATISNAPGLSGVAFTSGPGSTTISATRGGLTASATLTVTSATLTSIAITPLDPVRNVDDAWSFRAIGHYSDASTLDLTDYAAWSSDALAILVVSDAFGNKGDATAFAAGTATVSARFAAVTGNSTVTVNP